MKSPTTRRPLCRLSHRAGLFRAPRVRVSSRPAVARAAFTLIELLVVVAIIAILAAIALPNLLEAQVRSKVARTSSDLRTLAGALETYRADASAYPPSTGVGADCWAPDLVVPVGVRLRPLTTPVSYLSAIPADAFPPRLDGLGPTDSEIYDTYDYLDAPSTLRGSGLTSGGVWRLAGTGPDRLMAWGGRTVAEPELNALGVDYDPTNGTTSAGDIVRVGGRAPTGNGLAPDDPSNPERPGHLRR